MSWRLNSRERWRGADSSDGACEELSKAIIPFATRKTFLQYGDKVDRKVLIERRHLLHSLKSVHDKLAFTKRQVKGALAKVLKAQRNKAGWHVDDADQEAWLDANDKRLRKMCRHLTQTETSRPSTAWLRAMPWRQVGGDAVAPSTPACASTARTDEDHDDAGDTESQEELFEPSSAGGRLFPKATNNTDDYIFGYSSSAKAAWRVLKDEPNGDKDWCARFDWADEDADAAIAVWDDGARRIMPEVSVVKAKEIEAQREKKQNVALRLTQSP